MGYSKLESVVKQYSDIKLSINKEDKKEVKEVIAREGVGIVEKITSAMEDVADAERELEDSKYIKGDWTGGIPLVKNITGGKSKAEKQNEALRRAQTLHLKATRQLAQIQQETINYITKSLEFSIEMNAFLGMVIENGFIKKDGQITKLTEGQKKTLENMRKSVEAFINQHAETDKKFKEVWEAIWKNEKNILENKNRFSEIEQRIIEHESEIEKAFQEVGEQIDSNVKQINSEVDSLKQTITKHNDKAEQKFQEAHQQIDSNAKLISNNADKINSLEQTIIAQRKAISELEELKAHKTRLYIISIISAIIAIASLALHFIEM